MWICSTCCKHVPVLSSFMTYHRNVTRVTRLVPLVEQELLTLPEHLSSSPVFSGVRVTPLSTIFTRSLVLCEIFCRSLFVPLTIFVWPSCCLSFDLRILITSLISSNSSYLSKEINGYVTSYLSFSYVQF